MKKRVLITGGCGFVGHHFVEHIIKNTNWDIVVLDKLSYASNGFDRLRDISVFDDQRVKVLSADFSQPLSEGVKREIGQVDYIWHLGAESHVDNSIKDPVKFVKNNVEGTAHILNYAKELDIECFYYFSTDEVFGPAPEGVDYKEDDPHNPSNPYAATKSGAEMLVKAYGNTYKLPVIITRSMNIFGERQHPEKFIPLCIKKILKGEKIIIHANKDRTKSGSRMWIHARNVADAYLFLAEKGKIGETYHIVGEKEVSNLEMAQFIAETLKRPLKYEMVDFHSSRPGHDLRYALSGGKMEQLGWKPPKTFKQSLEKTIQWSLANKKWLYAI